MSSREGIPAGDWTANPGDLLGRPPLPVSIEAEQALLGAILASNEAYDRVADFIKPEHFADPVHARIFEACGVLIERGELANAVRLAGLLDGEAGLEAVGGNAYLARLQASFVTIVNAKDYGRTVHGLYLRRSIIALADRAIADAFEMDSLQDARELVDAVGGEVMTLAESGLVGEGPVALGAVAWDAYEAVERARLDEGAINGITTGFRDLDTLMSGGFEAPSLTILAGRPSMGKTAFATCAAIRMARAAAVSGAGAGLFFSLEMAKRQIATRILAAQGDFSVNRLRRGQIDELGMGRLDDAWRQTKRLPLWLDDSPAPTVRQMHARARRLKRQHGLAFVWIDHLGFIKPADTGERNKVYQIEQICHDALTMAKDLDVPVILLHQLSRKVEERDDKRPMLADLRDSGAIEQDADNIIFLLRDHYYIKRAGPRKPKGGGIFADDDAKAAHEALLAQTAHKATAIVAKQRQGPIDDVKLYFDEETMVFDDLAVRPGGG